MENIIHPAIKQGIVRIIGLFILLNVLNLGIASLKASPLVYPTVTLYTDTDGDTVPDHIDVDDDGDGIIDVVEDENLDGDDNPATNPTDTDGDGVPNYHDKDSDNDGILDIVEAQTTANYIEPCGIDSDGNGLDDHYEETPGSCGGLTPIDTDGDTIPDYLDIDSDNDGILDNVEAQTSGDFQAPCGMDADGNGLDDHYENHPGSGEGITPLDSDADHHPDFRDIDSDNDGILDNVEAQTTGDFQAPCGMDADGNGLDDHYENHPGSGEGITPVNTDGDNEADFRDLDSDNDGILDNVEAQTTSDFQAPCEMDADGNGLDDHYENHPGSGEGITPVNTDGDNEPDFRDLDSDNDDCYDTMEAGYLDALVEADRDGMLGNVSPPTIDGNGLVISGENGEGYSWPQDLNYNGILDFRETAFSVACESTNPINIVDDVASTEEGIPVEVDILANDTGIPSDGTLTTTDPDNGTVVINDGGTPNDISDDTVTYTPDSGFNDGTDTFEYTICDAMDNCDSGTVTVTVGTPEPLEVVDDVASTEEGIPVEVDILANDTGIPSDGTLTTTDPENGTVVINDGGTPNDISDDTVTYTPDSGFNDGTDTFEYTVCDAMDNCDSGTVTVTVGTPEPLEVVDDVASTEEGIPVEVDILANDTGIPSDGTLTTTDPENGTVVINDGGTPNDISDDTITYTPDSGFNDATDTFEYTVCDAMDNCDTATVTITVGTPPMLEVVDDVASTEADTPVEVDILANDTGIPSDGTLTTTDPENGTVVINDGGTPDDISDDTITYTPDSGFNDATDTFEYTVCDATDNCDTATVTITVGTPPMLDVVDDVASTDADSPVEVDILANDTGIPSDGTLTTTDPDNGTVVINDGDTPNDISDDTVTYTPDSGFNDGTDTFEYTVCDAMDNCDTATVTITVGTPPMLDAVDDVASTEADTPVEVDILANDTGIPSDGTLTTTDPENGTVVINDGGTPNDISDDTVTYTPDSGFNDGTDTFEYTVCDAMDNCDTATVTITVGTPPMLDVVDDVASTDADSPVEVDILANDTGIPSDGTLTTTDPENGTVVINDGGTPNDISDDTVTYTPDSGFNDGTDTFEYTVCDAMDNCDTATVTITVGTPPMLDAVDDVASTDADSPVEVDILANDTGIPSDGTLTTTDPENGTVVINDGDTPNDISDDTVTYTPDSGFNDATDTFEYTVCDAMDNCDTATVTITVGTPPMIDAVDDVASTEEDTPVEVDILANDIGVPNIQVLTVTDPTNGTVVINDGGTPDDPNDDTVTYTPDNGFNNDTDTFEYTICDDMENCDTATVTVTVGTPITIDAVDDDFTSIFIDGNIGGTIPDSNVLDNDTLNGQPAVLTDVVIISEPTGPLTIDSEGNVIVAPETPTGSYSIEYTICEKADSGNCDTAIVLVVVSEVQTVGIEVNQMVTPNNDGRNDFLFIRGVEKAKNNSLKIFNRWGIAVYEGQGYNNQNNVFDGRSKGRSTVSAQEYLPAGVYFYIFEYQKDNQNNITDSGYIFVSN